MIFIRFGKQCLKIFKIFVNSFCLIFLAEWGDRSQVMKKNQSVWKAHFEANFELL